MSNLLIIFLVIILLLVFIEVLLFLNLKKVKEAKRQKALLQEWLMDELKRNKQIVMRKEGVDLFGYKVIVLGDVELRPVLKLDENNKIYVSKALRVTKTPSKISTDEISAKEYLKYL